jgi:hypothetical protein
VPAADFTDSASAESFVFPPSLALQADRLRLADLNLAALRVHRVSFLPAAISSELNPSEKIGALIGDGTPVL